ncbi:MAG: site-specific integrase [Candidatus Bathyarchaeota archaeon]|nr:MAG: site-specific integrase [Candidatus Bathyarchaeota archaeon]
MVEIFMVFMKAPSLGDWRAYVDGLPEGDDKVLFQALYLTCSRASELALRVVKAEKFTKPYGQFLSYRIESFNGEPVLVLDVAVLKRKEKRKKAKSNIVFKTIALPCSPKVEPWTLSLLKYIHKHKALAFPLDRRQMLYRTKKWFSRMEKNMTTHSLRHFRISHLAQYYGFSPMELCQFAGWTFRAGMGASGQLDTYLHLSWQNYFPKLLRPLPA